jgi:hypothetical protein
MHRLNNFFFNNPSTIIKIRNCTTGFKKLISNKKSLDNQGFYVKYVWCGRRDLNTHAQWALTPYLQSVYYSNSPKPATEGLCNRNFYVYIKQKDTFHGVPSHGIGGAEGS